MHPRIFEHALRSREAPAHRLLARICPGELEPVVSVPLLLEYEALTRPRSRALGLTPADVDDVLDHLCAVARPQPLCRLWRPVFPDRLLDLVLETAAEGQAECMVAPALGTWERAMKLQVRPMTPSRLLTMVDARTRRR